MTTLCPVPPRGRLPSDLSCAPTAHTTGEKGKQAAPLEGPEPKKRVGTRQPTLREANPTPWPEHPSLSSQTYEHNEWILHLAGKLLVNDAQTLSLLAFNPFAGRAPPR